jgi:endonuclease/exonuclease/phosphatase family metal-dependent hydrolase
MAFKVATWNISGQLRFEWPRHETMSTEVLFEIFPDLIGFQEYGVTCHHTQWKRMPHLDIYMGVPAYDINLNPIAWNRKRFDYKTAHTKWLSDTPEFKSKGWGGQERAFSYALLHDLVANRELLHVNTHLDNKSEAARVHGTQQILSFISNYSRDIPIIVTGDFNCSPKPAPRGQPTYSSEPYDLFLGAGFENTWRVTHPTEDWPTTFHSWQGEAYLGDDFATWHVDWIMSRGLNVLACEIIRTAKPPQFPSDHYPVEAVVDYV